MNKREELTERFGDEKLVFSSEELDGAIIGIDHNSLKVVYSIKKALIEMKKNMFPKYTKKFDVREFFFFNTIRIDADKIIWVDDED